MNLSYAYNFGSLAGIVLGSQIVTGILIAMHYTPHVEYALKSVIHLMNDVPSGMILRYGHANGASMLFVVVYMHILRGVYYSSGNKPRGMVWLTGIMLLIVMVITAFIGYVLPWGQMSFWGATVITSLATVLPVVGENVVKWLWGGYSLDNPTLNRFYSLHYTLPFIMAGISVFHIAALHEYGSTNPLGINTETSTVKFSTYYGIKDLLGLIVLAIVLASIVFFYPEYLGHTDNLIAANPYTTPQHIVPEWYLLWFYAILRSIPNKSAGVLGIVLMFGSLLAMPLLTTVHVGSPKFRVLSERAYWVFVADLGVLTWVGAQEIMDTTVLIGQWATGVLFVYLLAVYPLTSWLESAMYKRGVANGS